mmetsp:Transcript_96027/g.271811  ORF Transcript_96027/g.271811 Transcript_96027/m.271811 type:complete len:210 (+) Transcript_96027:1625-2254(+)
MHQTVRLCFTITDMRFRSEVNGNSCRTVNFRSRECGPLTFRSKAPPPCRRSRPVKAMPAWCAACTSATSSGDVPEKLAAPAPPAACTLWQTARHVKKLRTGAKSGSLWSALLLLSEFRICQALLAPSGSSSPCRRKSPRSWSATWHLAKTISLAVSVPVLSVNMKSTCPISSTRSAVRASAFSFVTGSSIMGSMLMKSPRQSFRNSKAT